MSNGELLPYELNVTFNMVDYGGLSEIIVSQISYSSPSFY